VVYRRFCRYLLQALQGVDTFCFYPLFDCLADTVGFLVPAAALAPAALKDGDIRRRQDAACRLLVEAAHSLPGPEVLGLAWQVFAL
jgi:hypothetical protein